MRITKSKLRRIIRKAITESFSGSYTPSGGGNHPRFPVEIDASRSTVQAGASDKLRKAIDALAIKEDLEQGEIDSLRKIVDLLGSCAGKIPASDCTEMILDRGLDAAFEEIGYILHDVEGEGEMSNYVLDVESILQDGLL